MWWDGRRPVPQEAERGSRERCGSRTPTSHKLPAGARRSVSTGVYGDAMTESDTPWEPPLAGTEVEHLVGALDRLRTTFRWKADDLDAARLQTRVGTSSLTLGGLLKHLAALEDHTFTTKLSGEPIGAPWDATGWDGSNDWEFTSAADDTPDELYALWDGAVERSRARLDAVLTDGGLDQPVHASAPDGRHASLRRLLCDLIEEYGRHTGGADLLREAVDGLVGEDPRRMAGKSGPTTREQLGSRARRQPRGLRAQGAGFWLAPRGHGWG